MAARARRHIALALLLVFAAGQATALAHMGGKIHDHEAPCAACRVAGEHATAVLPALPGHEVAPHHEALAPRAPSHLRSQTTTRSHPPRAPPLA